MKINAILAVPCDRSPSKLVELKSCLYCQYCKLKTDDGVDCIYPEFRKWYEKTNQDHMTAECDRMSTRRSTF